MPRDRRSRKSLDREISIIGIVAFGLASLAIIPLIVAVLYAVAYAPFGVALFIVIGYFTRRRWVPSLQARVQRFFASPIPPSEHPPQRTDLYIDIPAQPSTPPRRPRTPSTDLRDV